MGEWIKIVFISLISGLLLYLGKDKYVFELLTKTGFLGGSFNIPLTQTLCFMSGTILSVILLPIQLIRTKKRMVKLEKHYHNLISYNKSNLFSVIKEQLGINNCTFNLRIFVPQNFIQTIWNFKVHNKYVLLMKNVLGISDPFLYENLQFEVKGNQFEGMVGKSFRYKTLCIDFDLDKNQYHLTNEQQLMVGNIEFCSTIPIFNKKQNKI